MRRRLLSIVGLSALLAAPAAALAHHGWSWTTGGNIELAGTITEVRLGNPHGIVMLDVEGTVWEVEVGQPWRNDRSGLKREDLAKGVDVTFEGEPSADPNEKLLKAERLWIGQTQYELYPERS